MASSRAGSIFQITTIGSAVQVLDGGNEAPGSMIKIEALSANTGKVYYGHSNAVSATTGFELVAGQDSGWLPLNATSGEYWIIGTVGTDRVSFHVR